MTIKKEIIYPIFLECVQYTKDPFWKMIFDDLAYGKTPYGTYISKSDFLCCGYKDKEFSYKIERKDPEEVFNNVYTLLNQKLGILSYKEKTKKRLDFLRMGEDIQENKKDWNDIKKKNVKDLHIEFYVIEMTQKYSLSTKQSQYLLSIIFIAMLFKVITSKDIDYSDGKIHNIKGIEFDLKRIILKRNIYKVDSPFTPEIILDQKLVSENWDKYLGNLKKIKSY
jgi:hypothetical protein